MAWQKLTHAIVCRVPNSLQLSGKVDIVEARKQHESYVSLLRELQLDVIELPPDEALPGCAFVEDTAVICNGIALIARPPCAQREKEAQNIKIILKKELNLTIIEIQDMNAYLEGGDVLFTGKEFFVGLSKWTNEAGAQAVASAFPEYPCVPIKITGKRHLKYYVTIAGPNVLCVSNTKDSKEVLKRIEREATFCYQILTVPEQNAANVLYINGTLIHRSVQEIPLSYKVISEKMNNHHRSVNIAELTTFVTGLTTCCLVFSASKHIRNL